jgi:hypothetical protein
MLLRRILGVPKRGRTRDEMLRTAFHVAAEAVAQDPAAAHIVLVDAPNHLPVDAPALLRGAASLERIVALGLRPYATERRVAPPLIRRAIVAGTAETFRRRLLTSAGEDVSAIAECLAAWALSYQGSARGHLDIGRSTRMWVRRVASAVSRICLEAADTTPHPEGQSQFGSLGSVELMRTFVHLLDSCAAGPQPSDLWREASLSAASGLLATYVSLGRADSLPRLSPTISFIAVGPIILEPPSFLDRKRAEPKY